MIKSQGTEVPASIRASKKGGRSGRRGPEEGSLTDAEAESIIDTHVLILVFKRLVDLYGADAVAMAANVAVGEKVEEIRRHRGPKRIDAILHLQEMVALLHEDPTMKPSRAADRVAKNHAHEFPWTTQDSFSRRLQERYREMARYGQVYAQALKQLKTDK
jgi:hypothetical protein